MKHGVKFRFRVKIFVPLGIVLLVLWGVLETMFGSFTNMFSLGENHVPQIRYPVDNFYTAVLGEDGCYYTIANEKSTILKTDADGKILCLTENTQNRGKDSFSQANFVCADADGNFYVSDLEWSTSGFTVARERVLMYDRHGYFQEELFCRDYSEEEIPVQRAQLRNLQWTNEQLSFLLLDKDAISVYRISSGELTEQKIPYEKCQEVQDAVLCEDGTVYLTDKRCRVLQVSADGDTEILLDSENQADYFMPYRLACSSDKDTVYFTDLGNSEMCKLDVQTGELDHYVPECDDTEILQSLSLAKNHTLLFATDQNVYRMNRETGDVSPYLCMDSIGKLSAQWYVMYAMQAVALVFGAILLLIALVRLLVFLLKRYFAHWKIPIVSTVGIVLTAGLILPTILMNFRELYFHSYQEELYLLSTAAADSMSEDALEQIVYPSDYGSEAYETVREEMEQIVDRSYSYGDNIYINVLRNCNDRMYAVYYLDDSVGGYYPLFGKERELLQKIYQTGEANVTDDASDVTGSYTYVLAPVKTADGAVIGAVEAGMDMNTMQNSIRELFVDVLIGILMLIVVSVFFLNEIVSFAQNKSEYQSQKALGKAPLHELRLITMLCYAALNMPTSFMPVYLESLYHDGLAFSKSQCGSIPLTVNFALMAVMALFCAPIMRKFSFRTVAAAGSVICAIGDISTSLGRFETAFFGLILNGIGLGLLLNSFTICASALKTEEEKNRGFAVITSASLSGMLCGMTIGANLAKYVGESRMFLFSALLWAVELVCALLLGKHFQIGVAAPETVRQSDGKKMHWYQFLLRPSVLGFVLLIQFPASVIACFTSYYVPLFTDSIGMNEVRTGLVMVLNSLTGAFFSVIAADAVIRKLGKSAMYVTFLLTAVGILLFVWTQNVLTLILVMILFGISESVGAPARSTCYCVNPYSKKYGEDKAMGIYNFADNAGNSAGTSILGVAVGFGASVGFSLVMAAGGGCMGLYYLLFERKSKRKKREE